MTKQTAHGFLILSIFFAAIIISGCGGQIPFGGGVNNGLGSENVTEDNPVNNPDSNPDNNIVDENNNFIPNDQNVTLRLVRNDGTRLMLSDRPIPLRDDLEITFSEQMDEDAVVSALSVTDAGGGELEWTSAWNEGHTVLRLHFRHNFLYRSNYTVRITTDARTADGRVFDEEVLESFITMTKNDMNGDGHSDVVVAAPLAEQEAGFPFYRGKVYVYGGRELSDLSETSHLIDADDGALLAIISTSENEQLGYSVAFVGDVNADGYSDLLVGSHRESLAEGRAYLFLGRETALGNVAVSGADARLDGIEMNDLFGRVIAEIGDLNEDGYTEIAIGAPHLGVTSGLLNGAVLVYRGETLSGVVAPDRALVRINGAVADGQFGFSVASVGDVGIVGIPNLLVGSPAFSTPGVGGGSSGGIANRGAVYLYDGEALFETAGVVDSNDENVALIEILGVTPGSHFGFSVAGIGDLNGDNTPDFMAAAPIDVSISGAVFIFSGADFSELHVPLVSVGDPSLESYAKLDITTASGDEIFIAGMGDITGDSVPEVMVGAPDANTAMFPEPNGSAYIISGERINSLHTIDVETGEVLLRLRGEASQSFLGTSVAGLGQVDGDEAPDFLVGAASEDGSTPSMSEAVYIFSGTGIAGIADLTDSLITIESAAAGDNFGFAAGGTYY